VAPILRDEWVTTGLELPLLVVAVQVGFAIGALALALTGAPDVIPGRWLFVGGAVVAAASNLGFALVASDPIAALPFRALTGAGIAAVYPVAMKIAAGWFRRERGLAIGVLIGALVVGLGVRAGPFDVLFGAPAWLVLAVALVWGITVVADSAQFSAAVSELAPPGTAGSALAVQTAAGFLLTAITILAIGAIDPSGADGWRFGFALLAVGPLAGVIAMWRLRRRPEALRMANGQR
jgi:MFS family permease